MEPIRSVFEDDPDMAELIEAFAADLPARAAALEAMLEAGDLEGLQRLAHQLKGAGGGYGFPRVTEVAASLEEALKKGAAESDVKERTGLVCEVLRAVRGPRPT